MPERDGGPKHRERHVLNREFADGRNVPIVRIPPDLRPPQRLTWQQVYRQFGLHPDKASDKNTVQMFRRNILRELKKIKLAWPGLSYAIAPGLLILHPSHCAHAWRTPNHLVAVEREMPGS